VIELATPEGLDQVRDCILDARGVSLNDRQVNYIAEHAPPAVRHLAAEWGWSDTVVRDNLVEWLKTADGCNVFARALNRMSMVPAGCADSQV
jgi:hypothetical protein